MKIFFALFLSILSVPFGAVGQQVQIQSDRNSVTLDNCPAQSKIKRSYSGKRILLANNSKRWPDIRPNGLVGPDLFITPWGNITGVGFEWQTPDIFLVDDSDARVPPRKGQINRLRARVKNIGTLPANGVTIRFKYAPAILGTPDSIFKEIGSVSANFEAGQTKDIAICWDLTDVTDTNGGIWPTPMGTFDHFCIKVFLEFTGDVDLSNNIAQTNFFDVPPSPSGAPPFMFLFGNPFKTEVEAELILDPALPPGFGVELRGSPVTFGKRFKLKPEEIRSATIAFTVPPDLAKYPPSSDVVANVSLRIRGKLTGGFSVRLARKVYKNKGAF